MRIFASYAIVFMIGFAAGYPFGLFIDYLDKKEKDKNVG